MARRRVTVTADVDRWGVVDFFAFRRRARALPSPPSRLAAPPLGGRWRRRVDARFARWAGAGFVVSPRLPDEPIEAWLGRQRAALAACLESPAASVATYPKEK